MLAIRHSPLATISFVLILFQTLSLLSKRYPSSFHHLPNSFPKTPGVGTPISHLRKESRLRRDRHTMKSNSTSAILTTRCSHRTAAGRQCRSLSHDADSGLCPQHLAAQQHANPADVRHALIIDWKDFQTAQGINFTLGSLYNLLAANHISSRRAAVLAYISSLMLRTHSAIDADREGGIDTSDSSADALQAPADPTREALGQLAAVRALAPPAPDPLFTPEPDPIKKPS